jgi:hypothetical protein
MPQAPKHEWTADPRVSVALCDLGDITRRHFHKFTRDEYWVYEGTAATALKAIRSEYGNNCLAYADADWDARKHVATAWLNTKTVDQLIDEAFAAKPLAVAA